MPSFQQGPSSGVGPTTSPVIRNEADTIKYYEDFKKFLAVDSAFDTAHKRRLQENRAQQKLLRLSAVQFHELATDVHDEMLRRILSPAGQNNPHLLPERLLHPKRNQAREKLSLLSPPKFNDLAFDILFEIERRNPNLKRLSKHLRTLSDESDTASIGGTNPQLDNKQGTERSVKDGIIPVSSMLNEITPPSTTPTSPATTDGTPGVDENIEKTVTTPPINQSNTTSNGHKSHQMSTSTTSTFYSDAPSTANTDLTVPFEDQAKQDQHPLPSNFNNTPAPVMLINTDNSNQNYTPSDPLSMGSDLGSPPMPLPENALREASGSTPTRSMPIEESDEGSECELSGDDDLYDEEVESRPLGIDAAMQAWAYKNSSQTDITSLHRAVPPPNFSSDDEEGSDDNYSLAQEFNLGSFGNQREPVDTEQEHTLYPNATSASYDQMEAEMTRTFRLQSIKEETSPYISPFILKRASSNSPGEKRRSLSETMALGMPGGARSRSFNKLDFSGNASASESLQSLNRSIDPSADYQLQIKERDEQLQDKDKQLSGKMHEIKDKGEQIQSLIEERAQMDEKITKLEKLLAESELQKETTTEENGRLHLMINELETMKNEMQSEFDATKEEFNRKTEDYITHLEEKQRALANLEISHQKLKDKHADTMSKQSEFAGSSASLTSQIMLLEGKLLKQENVSEMCTNWGQALTKIR